MERSAVSAVQGDTEAGGAGHLHIATGQGARRAIAADNDLAHVDIVGRSGFGQEAGAAHRQHASRGVIRGTSDGGQANIADRDRVAGQVSAVGRIALGPAGRSSEVVGHRIDRIGAIHVGHQVKRILVSRVKSDCKSGAAGYVDSAGIGEGNCRAFRKNGELGKIEVVGVATVVRKIRPGYHQDASRSVVGGTGDGRSRNVGDRDCVGGEIRRTGGIPRQPASAGGNVVDRAKGGCRASLVGQWVEGGNVIRSQGDSEAGSAGNFYIGRRQGAGGTTFTSERQFADDDVVSGTVRADKIGARHRQHVAAGVVSGARDRRGRHVGDGDGRRGV